jgi:hypothetical protein
VAHILAVLGDYGGERARTAPSAAFSAANSGSNTAMTAL